MDSKLGREIVHEGERALEGEQNVQADFIIPGIFSQIRHLPMLSPILDLYPKKITSPLTAKTIKLRNKSSHLGMPT